MGYSNKTMKREVNNSKLATITNFRALNMNTKKPQKGNNEKNNTNIREPYNGVVSLVKNKIFGIGVTNATEDEVLEYVVETIQKTSKNLFIVTPNPEILMLAKENAGLKLALNEAGVVLCDGIGLFLAAKVLGKPLKERIIGTNVMEKLCQKVEDWPITVGFLGGREGVAAEAAECLLKKYPRLHIVFTGEEWHKSPAARQPHLHPQGVPGDGAPRSRATLHVLHKQKVISNTQPIDILFVAFGAPKQEVWMREHLNKIPVRVMMGVGGAFDQMVKPSLRPPEMIHAMGLGWLYRLVHEPWRLRRQAVLPLFAWEVVKAKFVRG